MDLKTLAFSANADLKTLNVGCFELASIVLCAFVFCVYHVKVVKHLRELITFPTT